MPIRFGSGGKGPDPDPNRPPSELKGASPGGEQERPILDPNSLQDSAAALGKVNKELSGFERNTDKLKKFSSEFSDLNDLLDSTIEKLETIGEKTGELDASKVTGGVTPGQTGAAPGESYTKGGVLLPPGVSETVTRAEDREDIERTQQQAPQEESAPVGGVRGAAQAIGGAALLSAPFMLGSWYRGQKEPAAILDMQQARGQRAGGPTGQETADQWQGEFFDNNAYRGHQEVFQTQESLEQRGMMFGGETFEQAMEDAGGMRRFIPNFSTEQIAGASAELMHGTAGQELRLKGVTEWGMSTDEAFRAILKAASRDGKLPSREVLMTANPGTALYESVLVMTQGDTELTRMVLDWGVSEAQSVESTGQTIETTRDHAEEAGFEDTVEAAQRSEEAATASRVVDRQDRLADALERSAERSETYADAIHRVTQLFPALEGAIIGTAERLDSLTGGGGMGGNLGNILMGYFLGKGNIGGIAKGVGGAVKGGGKAVAGGVKAAAGVVAGSKVAGAVSGGARTAGGAIMGGAASTGAKVAAGVGTAATGLGWGLSNRSMTGHPFFGFEDDPDKRQEMAIEFMEDYSSMNEEEQEQQHAIFDVAEIRAVARGEASGSGAGDEADVLDTGDETGGAESHETSVFTPTPKKKSAPSTGGVQQSSGSKAASSPALELLSSEKESPATSTTDFGSLEEEDREPETGGYAVGRSTATPSRLRGQSTIDAMRAVGSQVPGARLTSGYRTGSTTYHGKAQATDWGGPKRTTAGYRDSGLKAIFNRFAAVGSKLKELFLSGAPYWILNGQRRNPKSLGSYSRLYRTHKDHVHVATTEKNLGAGSMAEGDEFAEDEPEEQAPDSPSTGAASEGSSFSSEEVDLLAGIFGTGASADSGVEDLDDDDSVGAEGSMDAPNVGAGQQLSDQELWQVIRSAGFTGQGAVTAFAVAKAESGGNAGAHNPNASTGDNSYGLFQINMLGSMGPARRKQFGLSSNNDLFNPIKNAQVAFSMSRQGTHWSPWSVHPSSKGRGAKGSGYQQHLATARKMASEIGGLDVAESQAETGGNALSAFMSSSNTTAREPETGGRSFTDHTMPETGGGLDVAASGAAVAPATSTAPTSAMPAPPTGPMGSGRSPVPINITVKFERASRREAEEMFQMIQDMSRQQAGLEVVAGR